MRTLSALLISLLLVPASAFASISPITNLRGYVTSFDDKKVTVESGQEKVEVPRSLYPQKVRTGEYIAVALTSSQLSKLKKTPVAKK